MPAPPELVASLLAKWGTTLPGPDHAKHHVAVVGAGVSGLVAARILQRHGHSVTLFEREESPKARFQGGTLDMHPHTGQLSLELAGLTKEFQILARPEGEEIRLVDKNATVCYQTPPASTEQGDRDCPEVDRGQLRQILLDSLELDTVQWGSSVTSAEATQDGAKVRLVFKAGAGAEKHANKLFDAIIGADGAWSRVRSVLSPAKPEYLGVVNIELSINDVDTRHPAIAALVGNGTLTALEYKKAVIAQRNSGGNVRVYCWLPVPLTWPEDTGLAALTPSGVAAYLRAHVYTDWDERLLALFDAAAADTEARGAAFPIRPMFQLAPPHEWKTFPGGRITLVGDAAHLLFPTGEGANIAMLDGAEAALAIASARDAAELEGKIAVFEEGMIKRGSESATKAAKAKDTFINNERGAVGAAEHLRKILGPGKGES